MFAIQTVIMDVIIDGRLKEVPLKKFVDKLHQSYLNYRKESGVSESEIAVCLGKSGMTIRNCFITNKQMVSDAVIMKLMECVGMEGLIIWEPGGTKKYYIVSY
jgi:hypothetical protein